MTPATLPPDGPPAAHPALPQDVPRARVASEIGRTPEMPSDRSGPTSSLIAALRADITRRSERQGRQRRGDIGESADETAALKRELADLVRTTPADDPEGLQRRMIEAVLRWEFGGTRAGSRANPMLEQVARTIQADPQHRERFARLVRELQQP